jgi:hypothetical protein
MTMTISVERSSWTPHAAAVLRRACEYYGGFEAWRALRCIRLLPGRLCGLVPWLKGVGSTFPLPSAFEIFPHERLTRFVNYPDEEHTGIYANGTVRIERNRDKTALVESKDHRLTFGGLASNRRWSPLDALYFFGYALAHYHSLPFSLFESRLVGEGMVSAQDVLVVDLPPNLPTHSRRQRFYFDPSGQLTRHDYHAEIVGMWARGAHFWRRQTKINGFPIALERHVLARLGTLPLPVTALCATFVDAEVEFDSPDGGERRAL